MTKNEIFDFVLKGILRQGGPSVNKEGECLYRGDNGRKCAIGLLIHDDDYISEFEGLKPWVDMKYVTEPIDADKLLLLNYLKLKNFNLKFLRDLQIIHDECSNLDDFKFQYITRMLDYARDNHIIYDNSYESQII